MEINELAALGHTVAAVLFSILSALMLSRWNDRPKAAFVALAAAATAVWAAIQVMGSLGYLNSPVVLLIVEWIRNIAWLITVSSILRDMDQSMTIERSVSKYGVVFLVLSAVLIISYALRSPETASMKGVVGGGILLSALILIVIEQIYRNAPFDPQSGLRYLCVGVAGLFVYDFAIFTLTIVNLEMNVDQWAARGFVNAFFAVPLALAAQRSFRLSLDNHIPRQIVLYSFTAIGAGAFLTLMVMGDYYVSNFAGGWSGVLRIVLFVAAISALVVLLVSATIRARVRVFVMKTFFQYKYDYRKEWLRFIGTLSESDLDNVANAAVRAVAQIVNSPGGIVWVQEEGGNNYLPVGAWESELPVMASVSRDDGLVRFLKRRQWIVDFNEMSSYPARYEGLELGSWAKDHPEWWLVVPLFLGNRLFGFIILARPNIVRALNFEDHDLLRTVGRHVATHIDQAESDRRLAESSQFGTYNRLTAFLMHDLNNLIAQQSLVVKNAEKHRHNPEFVDDAINTIANSVSRMRRLMGQLSSGPSESIRRRLDLCDAIRDAIKRVEPRKPAPRFDAAAGIEVKADRERLTTVFEHLLRNAQDATGVDGEISIDTAVSGGVVVVRIIDNGSGMTPDFISKRLFRPFDSTKGSESMGIGAYQAREYVRELGGQLAVSSEPGKGTTFSLSLPLAGE
jgi:putative PEP-CTERM system histidine kinase